MHELHASIEDLRVGGGFIDVWPLLRVGASGRGVLGAFCRFSFPIAMLDFDGVLGGERGADDMSGGGFYTSL